MATTLIFAHGRGPKPGKQALEAIWLEALNHAFSRFQAQKLAVLTAAPHEFVYFGDLTTRYLVERGESYDEALDLRDRRAALDQLKTRKRKTFYSRSVYERLPGKNSLGELLADVGLPIMRGLRLSRMLLERYAPDYLGYWDASTGIREQAIARFSGALREPMSRGDDVIVVAHCMGSVLAFDALWALCHTPQPDWYQGQKVALLLTLGSPLGDETVKQNLLGASRDSDERFPSNIVRWINISAEDDYIAHDNTVANDYKAMLSSRLISAISDDQILNLTVRYGRSNAHSAIGYLVNPLVVRTLAEALPDAEAEG